MSGRCGSRVLSSPPVGPRDQLALPARGRFASPTARCRAGLSAAVGNGTNGDSPPPAVPRFSRQVIVANANLIRARTIVMSTGNKSGLVEAFAGSSSNYVCHNATCSVLVVRPQQ